MFERIRRYFFEKRAPETGRGAAERELRGRMAPLRGQDPDRLASAIDGFRAGALGPLARGVEEFETRDDTMKSCSRKMRAAAARCPHQVLIREGVGASDRGRAEAHRRALERLWANVRATDALARNQRGGFRLLLKQMMDAQSFGFAAHELVWRPRPDGSMDLVCVKVPLQFFENRTGALRYLRDPNLWEGEEMAEGEWMVTAGDGVGIAASIAAMGKRLSLQDWLLFSERCGQPGLHARTDAKQGSEQWENLVAAVANFGREWGIVTDRTTEVDTVTLANGGTPPYPGLVERMDRAIATLYRGSDLSTLSADGGSVGASQQGGEAEILEQDACEMLSETLQEQVERPYIRYVFGDDEPLAYVQVSPVSRPDLDMEMRIDRHLVSLGVPLSRKEALERYQRSMAAADDPDDEPLRMAPGPDSGLSGPSGAEDLSFRRGAALSPDSGLPNETPAPQDRRKGVADPLQNARMGAEVHLPPPDARGALQGLSEAFARDMGPAADELRKLLDLPDDQLADAARDLMGRLDDLLPSDPETAAVLAEAMAEAFEEGAKETISVVDRTADKAPAGGESGTRKAGAEAALANDDQPRGKSVPGTNSGSFVKEGGGSPAAAAPSDAGKKDGESGTPDRNASPTKPTTTDGKSSGERSIPGVRANKAANDAAIEAGYPGGVREILDKAAEVPAARVAAIHAGYKGQCEIHEAVAVMAENKPFPDVSGAMITFRDNQTEKYLTGKFREDGKPKPGNLKDLPWVIQAVRSDKYASSRIKFPEGAVPDYLDPPWGTQREYHIDTDRGTLDVFVYVRNNVINGWHIPSKKKNPA